MKASIRFSRYGRWPWVGYLGRRKVEVFCDTLTGTAKEHAERWRAEMNGSPSRLGDIPKSFKNESDVPDVEVKRILPFLDRELEVDDYDFELYAYEKCVNLIKESYPGYSAEWPTSGLCRRRGSRQNGYQRPTIQLGVGANRQGKQRFPVVTRPSCLPNLVTLSSPSEALIYVAAHELRHIRQELAYSDKSKPLRLEGVETEEFYRLRFQQLGSPLRSLKEECDAQHAAVKMLEKWRQRDRATAA